MSSFLAVRAQIHCHRLKGVFLVYKDDMRGESIRDAVFNSSSKVDNRLSAHR